MARLRPKYQQKFPKNPLFMKKEPSFVEFVEYLIKTPVTKYDEHWKPQFLLCPPCHFKFDVIVKMETFDRWKQDTGHRTQDTGHRTQDTPDHLFQGHQVHPVPARPGGQSLPE